jgi:uncharacterized surface protein with fasciclin (FAS1) repeats
MTKSRTLLTLALALPLAACGDSLPEPSSDLAPAEAAESRAQAAGQQTRSVVETALAVNAESGEFSTLIAALVATNLVGAVDDYEQVTVFAPTDAAFAAIGLNAGNVGDLDVGVLTDVLLYHLKEGRQFSRPVLNKKQIEMENGGFTFPDASIPAIVDANGGVAPIVGADVPATNGVIHVIGSVLIP